MTSKQHARLRMFRAVYAVLKANKPQWEHISVIVTLVEQLGALISEIEQLATIQESHTSLAQQKADIREELTSQMLAIIGIIKTYANITNQPDLFNKVNYSKWSLENEREQTSMVNFGIVLNEAKNLPAELSEYGLTPEIISNAEANLESFKNLIGQPRKSTVIKSDATKEMAETFVEINELLDTRLDNIMVQFNGSSLYNQYISARVIVDAPTRSANTEESNAQ